MQQLFFVAINGMADWESGLRTSMMEYNKRNEGAVHC